MSMPEDTIDPSISPPVGRRPLGWRPLVVRLHFYAGVLVAPFILVAAITGALYAIAPTLERFVYDDVLFVDPGSEALPLSEQAAAARNAFPQLEMSGLRPPVSPTDSTRINFTDPSLGDDELRAVFVDPYTGRVLGDEITWFGYLPLSTWLDGLHRHLNLGEPGRVYSELAASWLWVVALGGVYLWIAKARNERRRGRAGRLLTVDRSAEGRSRTLNWHGATGIWLLAGLLFLSATGITWSTYAGAHVSDLRAALNWERPQLDTASAHGDHGGAAASSADFGSTDYNAIIDAAGRAGVHAPLELTLPTAPGEAVNLTEIDEPYRLTTDAAAVDPSSLAVTNKIHYWSDYSTVAKLADWGIRMHMGFLFGWLNQLLLFGAALALVTVIVRGYRMWWQRRPTRGSGWAVGRPPLRVGVRKVHPAGAVAIAVVGVGVGWFLPLLGISLVGFLVVDASIAAVKARRASRELSAAGPTLAMPGKESE
jgi:uncharacterized iron-regulated membrane protein